MPPLSRRAAALALLLLPAAATTARAYPVFGDSADRFNQSRESQARADGLVHVDTPALITRLGQLHVTTYAFLLWKSPSDFADLEQEFLPAATRAGIEVWAYLVPPSELHLDGVTTVPPCDLDYVCWGDRLGKLAAAQPALTTFLMDDFSQNKGTFTPAYVQSMVTAARAHAPSLRFLTVSYYPPALTDLADSGYKGWVDGLVFPYTDLDSNAALPMQLGDVCAAVKQQLGGRCLLMVYGGWTSWHKVDPTVAYVSSSLTLGHDALLAGKIDGVMTYRLDKTIGAPRFDAVAALYAAWNPPPPDLGTAADALAPVDAARSDAATTSIPPGGTRAGCACDVSARGEASASSSLLLALLVVLAILVTRPCSARPTRRRSTCASSMRD